MATFDIPGVGRGGGGRVQDLPVGVGGSLPGGPGRARGTQGPLTCSVTFKAGGGFHQISNRISPSARREVNRAAHKLRDLVEKNAEIMGVRDTGNLIESIEVEESGFGSLTGTYSARVRVAAMASDLDPNRKEDAPYPYYQNYGTIFHPARPFYTDAVNAMKPEGRGMARRILDAAMHGIGGGGSTGGSSGGSSFGGAIGGGGGGTFDVRPRFPSLPGGDFGSVMPSLPALPSGPGRGMVLF